MLIPGEFNSTSSTKATINGQNAVLKKKGGKREKGSAFDGLRFTLVLGCWGVGVLKCCLLGVRMFINPLPPPLRNRITGASAIGHGYKVKTHYVNNLDIIV